MFHRKISLLLLAAATGLAVTTAAVLGRQAAPANDDQHVKQRASLSPAEAKDATKKSALPPPGDGLSGHDGEGQRSGAFPLGAGRGGANDPRSRQILAKLEEPVVMSFPMETPLEDVLKYIKKATTTPAFGGIPIYVDPVGLQEAERSMSSTVTIDLAGVPLRKTLQLLLKQLGMVYYVEDGVLVITSEDSEHLMSVSMPDRLPLLYWIRQAERGELSPAEISELAEYLKRLRLVMELYPEGCWGANSSDGVRSSGEPMVELLKHLREMTRLLQQVMSSREAATPK